jgi:putative flavoprotein involved in K+ transport
VSAAPDSLDGITDVDVLVVGAGQAGLGTGYWLGRRTRLSFLVVDGTDRIGDSWRQRWDSLELFTPRRFSSLPGTAMPRGRGEYPSKDETADYLAAFADNQGLPIRPRTRVLTLEQDGLGGFVADTTTGCIRARHVVVASGPYNTPFVPEAADGLDPSVAQLHSSAYRRPGDLPGQDVLVVGAGNSAAQLAVELAASRRVTVAAPGGMWFLPARVLGVSLYWWLWLTGILNGPSGNRVSRMVRARGDGVIGRDLQALVAAGTVRMRKERVCGARGRAVVLADGTEVRTNAVLWCTDYRPDHAWLRVPGALDEQGRPVHGAGRSPVPGLHWVGLPWQTRLNSGIIDGVDRDARKAVRRIMAEQARDSACAQSPAGGM